jgi:hypothetical protein
MSEPRRLRFSLQTLLLVTTIVAMGITIWLLMREVGPLRAEVKKLREETGKLWIEDETKIHAIRIDDYLYRGACRYRVWLPRGRKYLLKLADLGIPEEGLPETGKTLYQLESGSDQVITHILPTMPIESASRRDGPSGLAQARWDFGNQFAIDRGLPRTQQTFDADEPVVLHRDRLENQQSYETGEPTTGRMLWIEPVK